MDQAYFPVLQYEGQEYHYLITFNHYKNNELGTVERVRSGTFCNIWFGNEFLGCGMAICKPGEPFDEVIGRNVSLSRAMDLIEDLDRALL